MARLDPENIVKNGGQYGKSPQEVMAMLLHHGFEKKKRGHALTRFVHPKHPCLQEFNVAHNKNTVDAGLTYDAAKLCMRVKELDAAREAGGGGGGTGCTSRLVIAGFWL